ncbi:hypothetical protein OGAPHI_005507 [Ogataea philodendri]|uniref:Uncharacterized protein n=1 Tax=Ogataea philodendri TaxID=1378263 RepID=A0A9P8NZD1_9ASCO|nr:uncharacterized protein OGAPHI_005507 [Ogataea philodendri]KAH3662259.1 hypothetical protein OGAPHI_005507 [Ogataea philodendri]
MFDRSRWDLDSMYEAIFELLEASISPRYASTSPFKIRPLGPVAGILARASSLEMPLRCRSSSTEGNKTWFGSVFVAEDVDCAGLDCGCAFGSGGGAGFSVCFGSGLDSASISGSFSVARSSSGSARNAIGVPTLISLSPSCLSSFATIPSSWASTSMVALSVSTSSSTSPELNLSPSFTFHETMPPSSMVGDMAGIPNGVAFSLSAVVWKAAESETCK